jgi:hypothetical protein
VWAPGSKVTFPNEVLMREVLIENLKKQSDLIQHIMHFNILHHHSPDEILTLAYSVLAKKGKVGIIHCPTDIEKQLRNNGVPMNNYV